MFDRWGEVLDTIKRNKLRTALTAVSVAWGIFVMVVLLGMGRGLDQGVQRIFRREAVNGIWIEANKTSVAYGGYDIGRHITFENRDYDRARTVAGIDHSSGQYFVRGGRYGGGALRVRRGTKANTFQIDAVHPDAIYMSARELIEGRFLNADDVAQNRKAAVIGRPVRDFLFPNHEDPIGQWLDVAGVAFEVVGVFSDPGGEDQERRIIVPVSTAQLAFHGVDHLGMVMFTVGDADSAQAKKIERTVVGQLAERHNFSPDDEQAVRVDNSVEQHEKFERIFKVIAIFVVIIGLGTLAAGVVGVSNIMMIAVKERTKEIGVRKALGATPLSIVVMITQEAVFLTAIAGLLGLAGGVLVLSAASSVTITEYIYNPSIDMSIGIAATVGLVVAGALAGYVPARAAAKVNPIHALRDQ